LCQAMTTGNRRLLRMVDKLAYWIGFNIVSGIGPARLRRLQAHFGDLEQAWHASVPSLMQAGLDEKTAERLVERRSHLSLGREMEKLAKHNVIVITWDDPAYPARLKEIYAPPPVLYVRGSIKIEDEWAVGVVGTRRATVYGREVTERIAADLARHKITVVSGMAKGIDAVAHRACLHAGGRTIAVLGCGVDVVYPPENLRLSQEIIAHGALVSDYPLGTKPDASNFPPRNRIISGLSLGVLVTEAGESSGAHITVNFALEQNREVFAVPGSILSPLSRGPNRWIQQGAKLVMTCQDILEELHLTQASQQLEMKELIPTNDIEAGLLKHLSAEPMHIDEVRRESGLPIAVVSSTLAMMELKGLVRQVGGMNYVLAR